LGQGRLAAVIRTAVREAGRLADGLDMANQIVDVAALSLQHPDNCPGGCAHVAVYVGSEHGDRLAELGALTILRGGKGAR
jgi:hypothetical protein